MNVLNDISKETQPGKSTDELGYTSVYDLLFRDRRHKVRTMLEIGVLKGDSLRMWKEYFDLADIYGIDLHTYPQYLDGVFGNRMKVFLADQSKPEELKKVMAEIGDMDFICDDGSHKLEDQITSLETLFPFLVPGGVYVIEDLKSIEEIKPFLAKYDHFFAIPNDKKPESHDGSILAIIRK